jgi:Iron-containing redox enzyme
MSTTLEMPKPSSELPVDPAIRARINSMIEDLIRSLPNPKTLTSEERRALIARYSSVLEGNFIYWMTATLLSVHSEEAKPILLENLHEEVRDAHPAMLRRFTIAAHAFPTESDAEIVNDDLTKVRLFLGKLSGVQSVLTMALFEGFIQRFMGYLADLAKAQGSEDMEYTDVHGVCDIAHTEGLFCALAVEMSTNPLDPKEDPYEGANLLRNLLRTIVFGQAAVHSA